MSSAEALPAFPVSRVRNSLGKTLGWIAVTMGITAYVLIPVFASVNQTTLYPSVARVHLGKLKRGTQVKQSIPFRNLTVHPLDIQNVTSSCGCTATAVHQTHLSPLQATVVHITLDTTGLDNSFRKTVFVEVTPMSKIPARVELDGTLTD
jgi:hypothetical protein